MCLGRGGGVGAKWRKDEGRNGVDWRGRGKVGRGGEEGGKAQPKRWKADAQVACDNFYKRSIGLKVMDRWLLV